MFMCTLLVHHPLSAWLTVNKFESTIVLNWTVPTISGINPDISGYCLNVTDTTLNFPLNSICGISATKFSYPIPHKSWCSVYVFTVYIADAAEEQDSILYQGADTPPRVHEALRNVAATSASTFSFSLNMVRITVHAMHYVLIACSCSSMMDLAAPDFITNVATEAK